ncbi:LysR family transcriptional regulator [Pseudomonas sp. RW407]|uniref:LysR family transcriptional regulator n=1 Tax=Pseudomonas sp. RW407 TaxID=2202894 RepID=UPI000D6FD66E|nr:LysR family transcriptional regulator [Pseudomonas sp. RW407]PWU29940.1 LysR family transcriptional regulator [Pseudomonas sp. RW407]
MTDPLHKLSWDDLRIVKAIGEGGSLVAAAAALGLNHSTVSRRLAALEGTLGVALFDRRRSGYAPTAAGAELVELGARLEQDIFSVARRVSSPAQGYKGDLRVTTSDALLLDFLTPIIAGFQAANPEIHIEVLVSNQPLNLARGDSDVAFRATLVPPENLFGRKVATVAWAIYGRRVDYVGHSPALDELWQRQWVSYGRGLAGLRAYGFVEQRVAPQRIGYRSDSVAGVAAAIAAGMGIGFLPCMHGDLVPGLVRISPVQPEVHDELWVLTHPDIRKSGRVYAFLTHCAEAIVRQRDFIEGREPRPASLALPDR